jgi:uncharacterized peroxidase-related enzyme
MSHIKLNNNFPGMTALLYHRPDIGRVISPLAQAALRGPSSLTPGERELIGACVSNLNNCNFCRNGHAAIAAELLPDDGTAVACVLNGQIDDQHLSPKMSALLHIAARVQESGRAVTPEDIERARAAGASDDDIHDAVLVAALFCFFNRYVDGLNTFAPTDQAFYRESAKFMAKQGYPKPNFIGRFFIKRMLKQYPEAVS